MPYVQILGVEEDGVLSHLNGLLQVVHAFQ